MRDPILPGGVHVPPVRPCPHRQHDLLPHEAPRQVRVEGHVLEETRRHEEETGGDERYLGRRDLVAPIPPTGIDPEYVILDVVRAEFTIAQPRSRTRLATQPTLLVFAESGGVGAEHGLRVTLRGLQLVHVQFVPMFVEFEMRIDLHEVRLPPP